MTYDKRGITALADPTRRRIFELVAQRPRTVADLTRAVRVTQPAVSQHLKVLRDARLVRSEKKGASHIYHLDPHGLGEMRGWLDRMWGSALEAFKNKIDEKGQQ